MITARSSAWDEIDEVRRVLGDALIVLDYDGTLTPIASRPELAVLDASVREILVSLARRSTVAVLSGRGLDDVQKCVGVDELTYGGCHGLEISGPGHTFVHGAAEQAASVVAAATTRLRQSLAGVAGAMIEKKAYSTAVHYRLADDAGAEVILRCVREAVDASTGLRLEHGKRVFEIVPDVAWHKGHALTWMREHLAPAAPLTIYIGDDLTDENAFIALSDGLGILVADPPRETAASRRLTSPADVKAFLAALL